MNAGLETFLQKPKRNFPNRSKAYLEGTQTTDKHKMYTDEHG